MLALHCCAGFFPSCSERGLLFAVGRRLQKFQLPGSRAQTDSAVTATGSAAPLHVGSSQIRGWTCVSCLGGRILCHWTTREVFFWWFLIYKMIWFMSLRTLRTIFCLFFHIRPGARNYYFSRIKRISFWDAEVAFVSPKSMTSHL